MIIDILLATYNGEKFIEEQLASISRQTYFEKCRIIISDDGSTDRTREIIQKFADRFGNAIVVNDKSTNRGAKERFEYLLSKSTADYVMFCDQDDIWLPKKVEYSYKSILRSEKLHGLVPTMGFSDLIVGDEYGNQTNKSLWSYQGLRVNNIDSFEKALTENKATGCTIIMNGLLRDLLLPFPDSVVMHDWWAYLICTAYGKPFVIPETAIIYRQHSSNTVGARKKSKIDTINKMIRRDFSGVRRESNESLRQATAFVERFSDDLHSEKAQKLIRVIENKRITNIYRIPKNGYLKSGIMANIKWVIYHTI